jgi:hypothetical protein
MKKKIIAATMAAAMCVSLAACGGSTASSSAAESTASSTAESTASSTADAASTGDEEVDLRMAWWGSQDRHDRTIKAIELYESLHPNVKIEYEYYSFDDYFTKLKTLVASDQVWDIFQLGGNFPMYMDKIYPLDDYIASGVVDVSGIGDANLKTTQDTEGHQLGISNGLNSYGIAYDPDMFAEAGVAEPTDTWTWDDYANAANTIHDKSKSIGKTIWDAVPSLLLIVIVIGGIVSGIFTATEGAGIAVLYCLILSIVYKSITFKSFLKILLDSAKTSGIILFLISASSAMSFVMAYSGIPAAISNGLMSLTSNKYIIFLLMNIILLVIGMFMDITPAILIFTPIFLPIATSFGMTEIQFGVMLIFNMCLGNITPPVGSVLFVGCGIGHVSIEQVTSKLIPYFVALVLALLAVTYIPALSLGLPSLMGLI